MPATARVLYDLTDVWSYTRHNATLSGIQRVSIQLINRMVNRHGAERFRIIGWHPIRNRIVSFDASYFAGDFRYSQDEFCRHFGLTWHGGGASLHAYIEGKYGTSWKRPLHHGRLLLANSLTGGRTFEKRGIIQSRQSAARIEDGISFRPGDVIYLGGATWDFERYLRTLAQLRRERAVAVCHLVHDLIPFRTPEYVGDGVPRRFAQWLKHLSTTADYLLANSEATKRDVAEWMAENNVGVPTGVLPLAHQFGDSDRHDRHVEPLDDRVSARVRRAARLPYVLCVGTIETRKNVWTLANAWRRIHERLGAATPRLIFAGKWNNDNEDFEDFIKGTGSLFGYIRVLERPNDTELAFLYQRCLFSVFPSYKEGWGLPVGESLWFGRPVVCSSTSSMPEVGGSLADYIDPTSLESIEAAILKIITDAGYRERRAAEIAEARLRTWTDVANDLWHELTSAPALIR